MPDFNWWDAANYWGKQPLENAAGNAWGELNNHRPFNWMQTAYDQATRGDAYFNGPTGFSNPYGKPTGPEGFNSLYQQDPDTWARKVVSDYGVDLYGPFGAYAQEHLLPAISTWYSMFTPDTTQGGVGERAGAINNYMDTFLGKSSGKTIDYSTIGEMLSGTMAGNHSILSKTILAARSDPKAQAGMFASVIRSMAQTGAMSNEQLAVVLDELQYQYDRYAMSGETNTPFDVWLSTNASSFLDYYWSKEDWKTQPLRQTNPDQGSTKPSN